MSDALQVFIIGAVVGFGLALFVGFLGSALGKLIGVFNL